MNSLYKILCVSMLLSFASFAAASDTSSSTGEDLTLGKDESVVFIYPVGGKPIRITYKINGQLGQLYAAYREQKKLGKKDTLDLRAQGERLNEDLPCTVLQKDEYSQIRAIVKKCSN